MRPDTPPPSLVQRLTKARPIRFGLIGGVGFAVEAGVLSVLAARPEVGPILGRLVSFPAAVFVTWLLNRWLTFASNNSPAQEGLRYLGVQIVGALSNLVIYMALVGIMPALGRVPIVPLAIASLFAMFVNYSLSSRLVFIRHE